MADTLGSLVDKLSIVNIKLFMVQDEVNLAAEAGEGLEAETVAKLRSLNLYRNKLATEIDQHLRNAVSSGEVEVDPRIKT